jgi:hypothetical protein
VRTLPEEINKRWDEIQAIVDDYAKLKAALDVLSSSMADYDKGLLSAAILIDRLRAMLRERGKR